MRYTTRYEAMENSIAEFYTCAKVFDRYSQRLSNVRSAINRIPALQGFNDNINSRVVAVGVIAQSATRAGTQMDSARIAYLNSEHKVYQLTSGERSFGVGAVAGALSGWASDQREQYRDISTTGLFDRTIIGTASGAVEGLDVGIKGAVRTFGVNSNASVAQGLKHVQHMNSAFIAVSAVKIGYTFFDSRRKTGCSVQAAGVAVEKMIVEGAQKKGIKVGAKAGAAIGQALIPIPIVGAVIGGAIGGVVGGHVGKIAGTAIVSGAKAIGNAIAVRNPFKRRT